MPSGTTLSGWCVETVSMGTNQSTPAANVDPVRSSKKDETQRDDDDDGQAKEKILESKVLNTPILMDDDGTDGNKDGLASFPVPTGKEYDLMDKIAAELPSVIDDESRQQVEEYVSSCDNGKGPMVACYSTAEYVSLFLRKHQEAADLYMNTCFRPRKDKSPNGVEVDGTKAYPPSCYNLAQMRMTGKGHTKYDRKEGYDLFDRACRGGHGGACHMQAKMLASYPGAMGPGVPYNPRKAAELLDQVCESGDSLSCFSLATMLLRGEHVNADADNVSPREARGLDEIQRRKNEVDRKKGSDDERISLDRDPPRAEKLLVRGCEQGHGPSCYNVAVMYTQGDDGVDADPDKARVYQEKTEDLVKRFGGLGFGGSMG